MNLKCKPYFALLFISCICIVIGVQSSFSDTKATVNFEKEVLPILQNSCFSCHSASKVERSDSVTKPKGGVQLDSVKGISESQYGEVIVTGEPEDSLLYQRITLSENDNGIMPPPGTGKPLTIQQTNLIRKWIEDGANYGDWIGIQTKDTHQSDLSSHQPTVMPPITSLAFTNDGKHLVAGSQVGLQIYEWHTLSLEKTISVTPRNIHDLAFSPDNKWLAVGGGNPSAEGIIEILSFPEGVSHKILRGHRDSVMTVTWRDASSLVSGSMDRDIILWNLSDGTEIRRFKGHSRGVSSLCFIQDKEQLVSTGIDQNVRVWNVTTGELIHSMNNHTHTVHNLALRPNATSLPMIASASDDRTVRLWQPTIGRMVKFARLNAVPLNVVWLNDGSKVIASCIDGNVRMIDPDSVEITDEILGIDGWAYSLNIHPTDNSIAIGGENGQIKRIAIK
ncbi:hypothetical protein C6497_01720 [Candidatus Poribacteria bacterium]|nr:MAG: hypothetical protein C6497_01720 [Candidatus Poribacteria bacterium]